jgi:hypothetical protein
MFSKSFLVALSSIVAFGLAACADGPSKRIEPTWEQAANNPLVPANYRATDALLAQIRPSLGNGQPMIMATVVNIDALDKSSTLGRLISEQVAGRFTQAGYRMVEMKFGNAIYMKRDQGEMMLTREINNLAKSHDAQAVVVGTYGESNDYVFVNLKVIQPNTNVVLAVHDYVMPLDSSMRSLLRRFGQQ